MNRNMILVLIVILSTLILGIWIGGWAVASHKQLLLKLTNQPVADIFSSINALFAGFAFAGVIITVYIQIIEMQESRNELRKTADANKSTADTNLQIALNHDEKAVLDLFNTYCSEYFQIVKDSSMSVLIPCAASKEYYEFVVSRFFVADQLIFPDSCWEKVSRVSYCKTFDEFKLQEQRFRYKLDELINFFTLLAGMSNSKNIIRNCDFSYSWWRPLFWMIAWGQEKRFNENELIKKYSTPLYFKKVVVTLDKIYDFNEFKNDEEMWEYIRNHPKMAKDYKIDPLF